MKNNNNLDIRLVASKEDEAGMNIARFIKKELKDKLSFFESKTIYSDKELKELSTSEDTHIIFLSRHTAQSLRPSFTVHPVGNFSKPMFGGVEGRLVECHSYLLKKLLLNIKELVESNDYQTLYDYEVSLEVTHHGPFFNKPIAFIEVGSAKEQWKDLEACRLIADAVNKIDHNKNLNNEEWESVIGIGGNHYSKKFTKKVLESNLAFGHICAKYAIEYLTKELIEEMIEKTYPKPKMVLFDKKSMKRKTIIKEWCREIGIEVLQV